MNELDQLKCQTERTQPNSSIKKDIVKDFSKFIDEIDLQFKEDLIEKLYSTERIKRRRKMNEQKWRASIRRTRGSKMA